MNSTVLKRKKYLNNVLCTVKKQQPLLYAQRNEKAYSTWYSQAVSHPSTNQARPCLASEIGRDRACSGWYGRKRELHLQMDLLKTLLHHVLFFCRIRVHSRRLFMYLRFDDQLSSVLIYAFTDLNSPKIRSHQINSLTGCAGQKFNMSWSVKFRHYPAVDR